MTQTWLLQGLGTSEVLGLLSNAVGIRKEDCDVANWASLPQTTVTDRHYEALGFSGGH